MKKNNKSRAVVERATGRQRALLHQWRQKGILSGVHSRNGGYREKDLLALELAQRQRFHGFLVAECKPAVDWIRAIPKAAIDRMLIGGRRYLVVVGDRVLNPPCLLLRHGEIFGNPHFPWADLFSVPRPFAVLDVAEAMARVVERVEPDTHKPLQPTVSPPKQAEGVASTGTSSSWKTTPEPTPA